MKVFKHITHFKIKLKHRQKYIILSFLVILLLLWGCAQRQQTEIKDNAQESTAPPGENIIQIEIDGELLYRNCNQELIDSFVVNDDIQRKNNYARWLRFLAKYHGQSSFLFEETENELLEYHKKNLKPIIEAYQKYVVSEKGKQNLERNILEPDTKEESIAWRNNKYNCDKDLVEFIRAYEPYVSFMNGYLCNTKECVEEDEKNFENKRKSVIDDAVQLAVPYKITSGRNRNDVAWDEIMSALAVYKGTQASRNGKPLTQEQREDGLERLVGDTSNNRYTLDLISDWLCDYYFHNFDETHNMYLSSEVYCKNKDLTTKELLESQNEKTFEENIEESVSETLQEQEIKRLTTLPQEIRMEKAQIELSADRLQKLFQRSEYIREIPEDTRMLFYFFDGNGDNLPNKYLLLGGGRVIDYDSGEYDAEFSTGIYWLPRLEQSNDFCAEAKIIKNSQDFRGKASAGKLKLITKYIGLKKTFGKCIPFSE